MNLGASVVIKGEIVAKENLLISGRVEGTIRLLDGAELTLAAGSAVVGNIHGSAIAVLGDVKGDIVATERISVRTTAVIEGTLETPVLSVTEGAQINGLVDMPARNGAGVVKFPAAVIPEAKAVAV